MEKAALQSIFLNNVQQKEVFNYNVKCTLFIDFLQICKCCKMRYVELIEPAGIAGRFCKKAL